MLFKRKLKLQKIEEACKILKYKENCRGKKKDFSVKLTQMAALQQECTETADFFNLFHKNICHIFLT